MDITFNCTSCGQELAADEAGAGSEIECPSCAKPILIPVLEVVAVAAATTAGTTSGPVGTAPAPREPGPEDVGVKHHFAVPLRDGPTEILVKKKETVHNANPDKHGMRVRCIRRIDCLEVGKDHFDERVTEFLEKVGDGNIISVNTVNYSYVDMGTRQILTDYGVFILYKV
jgi:DNA-directed RNA polymerase subunit RPC12/RpoP